MSELNDDYDMFKEAEYIGEINNLTRYINELDKLLKTYNEGFINTNFYDGNIANDMWDDFYNEYQYLRGQYGK